MKQVDLSEYNITVENAYQSLWFYPKDFYDAFYKICPKGVKEPQEWKPVKKIMDKFSTEIGVYHRTVRSATESYIHHYITGVFRKKRFSSERAKQKALIAVMLAHYETFKERHKSKKINLKGLDLSEASALKRLDGYWGDWHKAYLKIHPEIVFSQHRVEWEGVQEIMDTLAKSINKCHVTLQEKKNAIIGATKSLILEISSKKWKSKQEEEIARVKLIMAYEELISDTERQAKEDSYPLLTEEEAKKRIKAWNGYVCSGFSRGAKYRLVELNYGHNTIYYDVCPDRYMFKYEFKRETLKC